MRALFNPTVTVGFDELSETMYPLVVICPRTPPYVKFVAVPMMPLVVELRKVPAPKVPAKVS
jgi:hypothetical protein